MKTVLILVLGIGLLTAGLSALAQTINLPVRLIIPAIKVDAKIEGVGLSKTGNGTMGIPSNFVDTAWYKLGTLPGLPGSSVIDGHFDGKYVERAVFYNLGRLEPGDLVLVIDQAGTTWKFRVINSRLYDYNARIDGIFSSDKSKARLNLITCAGDWLKDRHVYNQRIIVFTELVNN